MKNPRRHSTHVSPAGIDLVSTEPAPSVAPSPIVRDGLGRAMTMLWAPIVTSLPRMMKCSDPMRGFRRQGHMMINPATIPNLHLGVNHDAQRIMLQVSFTPNYRFCWQ